MSRPRTSNVCSLSAIGGQPKVLSVARDRPLGSVQRDQLSARRFVSMSRKVEQQTSARRTVASRSHRHRADFDSECWGFLWWARQVVWFQPLSRE